MLQITKNNKLYLNVYDEAWVEINLIVSKKIELTE